MAYLSGDYRSTCTQSSVSYETGYLLPRDRLEKIARILSVSEEKISRLKNDDWALQNKCFKKIVRACESDNWEKINDARALIFGIRDSNGRTVSSVLTSEEDAPPNFCTHPPENLVFQGGGPKGLAYIGAVEVLEERNIIPSVKRVAGTSAGAITATLIALGYSSAEVRIFLTSKSLSDFLDFSCSKSGICRGEEFLNWINNMIEAKTGIANCTFGELRREIKRGCGFKHLHVFAIKVGENQEAFQFSSERKEWDDLVIADAVRASMSLPMIFPPHILHFKDSYGKRVPESKNRSFMDGAISGMMFNLPIEAFDKKRYLSPVVSERDGDYYVTNRRTLAFSLYNPGEKVQKEDTLVDCSLQAYCEWKKSKNNAVGIYRKTKIHDNDRTVHISNCYVRIYDFWLSEQKMEEVINSGLAATRSFFLAQEEKLSRLQTFESGIEQIHFQPPKTNSFYRIYKNSKSQKFLLGIEIVGDNINFHTDYTCSLAPLLHLCKEQFSFSSLSELDDRFSIFHHLRNNELEKAESIYETHQLFFKKCFFWDLFREIVIEQDCQEYVKFFISKGFSFSNSSFDPLWYAYQCNAFKSFASLLKDPNVNLKTTEKNTSKTLLYYFAKEGQLKLTQLFCRAFYERHPESYKTLLDHEVNSSVGIKKTALVIAIEKQNFDVANFLIEEGADYLKYGPPLLYEKYKCCCNNMSARYFLFRVLSGDVTRDLSAVEKFEALRFCLTYSYCGGDPEHEHHASEWSNGESDIWRYTSSVGIEFAADLIRNKITTAPIEDIKDSNGNGFLLMILKYLYITSSTETLVKLLLSGKYTDNVNQTNNKGETPLILVAKYSMQEGRAPSARILAELLTIENIDVNHQDNTGNTALHYAASVGKSRATALLGYKGINPNLRNNLGRTPLHLTFDPELVSLLIQAGADDSIKDNNGKSSKEWRHFLMKPPYESSIVHVGVGVYQEIHESNMPLGLKIAAGSMITLMQPIFFPLSVGADIYSSIKHSITEDGTCTCFSCQRQRNLHKPE